MDSGGLLIQYDSPVFLRATMQTQRHKAGSHEATGVGNGLLERQAKECQGLSAATAAGQRQRRDFPRALRGSTALPAPLLDFGCLACGTGSQHISVALKHPVRGAWCRQRWQSCYTPEARGT